MIGLTSWHNLTPLRKLITLKQITNSGTSAVEKTVSGSIVHVEDALAKPLKSLVVNVDPVQDLHGYENPWPAGGGVNLIDSAKFSNPRPSYGLTASFDGDWIVISGTYTNTASAASFRVCSLSGETLPTKLRAFPDSASSSHISATTLNKADSDKTLTMTVTGMVQNETYNLRFRVVGYEGDTAPTEWTPYSNICPISGHTSAKVTRMGKNLLAIPNGSFTLNGITYSVEHGSLYIEGTSSGETSSRDQTFKEHFSFTLPEGVYLFARGDAYLATYLLADIDGTSTVLAINSGQFELTQKTTVWIGFYVYNVTTNKRLINCKININTISDYEPYQGETYNITFPSEAGTVYDAKLINEGTETWKLRVDEQKFVFSGNESWSYNSDGFFYTVLMQSGINVSDYYLTENGVKLYLNGNNGQCRIYLADNSFMTSETDVNTLLGNYGFVYELATPVTYTLTAQQVLTLLKGTNNIWADTGDVEVTYLARA